MAKLTKEQITQRRTRVQKEAQNSITQSEQLNIRIDEESMRRLYRHAKKCGKPVGTIAREWIIERLNTEENGSQLDRYDEILDSLSSLHKKIDKSKK